MGATDSAIVALSQGTRARRSRPHRRPCSCPSRRRRRYRGARTRWQGRAHKALRNRMLTVAPLTPADRAAWERLFRGYIAFYERDEPQAMYDRAWTAFMADERVHALGARQAAEAPFRSALGAESLPPKGEENGTLVGITHFFVHPNTSGPDVCYLQDLFTDE